MALGSQCIMAIETLRKTLVTQAPIFVCVASLRLLSSRRSMLAHVSRCTTGRTNASAMDLVIQRMSNETTQNASSVNHAKCWQGTSRKQIKYSPIDKGTSRFHTAPSFHTRAIDRYNTMSCPLDHHQRGHQDRPPHRHLCPSRVQKLPVGNAPQAIQCAYE